MTEPGSPRKMEGMARLRSPLVALVLVALAASCSSDGDPAPTGTVAGRLEVSAQLSSTDHYIGAPQRVGVGLILADRRFVAYGSVDLRFDYLGTSETPTDPRRGPSATGVYLPSPGTPEGGSTPQIVQPSEARGVYEATEVTFDEAGFWRVVVSANVEGRTVSTSAAFPVNEDPALPAPGDAALATENLTLDDVDEAPPGAVDSRAVVDGAIPDESLHDRTIADALKDGHPIVAVFSTPVFCMVEFCGPVTEVVEGLASRYDDRAEFVHVEIWRDHDDQVINQAAADWLLRNENLTEPWVYLIDDEGTIVDRWAVLFREAELEAALEALPPMDGRGSA
jgi:hypothetical protein